MRADRPVALLLLVVAAGSSSLLGGCAAAYSKGAFWGMGEYNARANEAVAQRYRQLQDARPAAAAQVMVLADTVPEGIEINGDVISVKAGYPLQLLGKYQLYGPTAGPWNFGDYKSTARKALCYWQAPLTWVTLGIWALVVPVAYPCWSKRLSPEEWLDEVRLLAVAAGGNVVMTSPRHGFSRGVILRASSEYVERARRGGSPSPPPPPPPPPAAASPTL